MRKHFISFLHCISRGDGVRGAHHMMQFGEKQSCANPAGFEADMSVMFRKECDIYSKRGVDVDRVSPHLCLTPHCIVQFQVFAMPLQHGKMMEMEYVCDSGRFGSGQCAACASEDSTYFQLSIFPAKLLHCLTYH